MEQVAPTTERMLLCLFLSSASLQLHILRISSRAKFQLSKENSGKEFSEIRASLPVFSSVGGDLRGRSRAVSFPEDITSRD